METTTEPSEKPSLMHILFRNPLLKLSIFIAGTAAAFAVDLGIDKVLTNYFPEYYETDAMEILENQDKHFDELKASLSDLKRQVSTDEGKQIAKTIGSLLSEAHADNKQLMITLEAIKLENSNLRKTLKATKGIDGGTDLRILEEQAVKIDSAATIGVTSVNTSRVHLTITNNGETKKTLLGIGSSASYISEESKTCTIAFLSESPNSVANFSRTCK